MPKGREVVVVTGASAGVGRAVVRRFARAGADVALIARGQAGLEAARAEVEAAGGRALALSVDVSDAAALESAADRVERELGPIDVWVNDAMTTVFAETMQITAEEFKRVTEVDYLGFVYGTQAALRRMLPRDRGTVVQVGSALAYRGIPLQSAYCGAKHAILGFTASLRCELKHNKSRVHVCMVQMPALNTPQFDWCVNKMPRRAQPVPPIYQPEIAAEAIYFAAHHNRREIYVGASTAITIAGNKLLPSLGDWYLGKRGYVGQQYDGAPPSGARANLWQPADHQCDAGAHGAFSDRAHARSIELWASTNKRLLALSALAALGVSVGVRQWRMRR
jgi:NAD(P)-dependent dehydrogenase (short-subunit alcohol dehydrogenase family)